MKLKLNLILHGYRKLNYNNKNPFRFSKIISSDLVLQKTKPKMIFFLFKQHYYQ